MSLRNLIPKLPTLKSQTRLLSASPALRARFREDIKPYAAEETQSGTSAEVAQEDEAYNPHDTNPETEKQKTNKQQQDGNPLNYSAANPNMSETREEVKSENKGTGKNSQMKSKKASSTPSTSGERRGDYK